MRIGAKYQAESCNISSFPLFKLFIILIYKQKGLTFQVLVFLAGYLPYLSETQLVMIIFWFLFFIAISRFFYFKVTL